MYTTVQLKKMTGYDEQQIRRWADQFSNFLEPRANPGKNKTRLFSEADASVIVFIADMRRNERMSFDDITTALKNGERAIVPDGEIVPAPRHNLAVQLEQLTEELKAARTQIQELEIRIDILNEERAKEKKAASARIEDLLKRIWELEQQQSGGDS